MSTIREERSWFAGGYVIVSDPCSPYWDRLPYRRFTVPWRGGRAATPWYPTRARQRQVKYDPHA